MEQKNKRQKAFTLVDSLLAMVIVLFGVQAVTRLTHAGGQHLFNDWERRVAWEILENALRESPEKEWETRYFDFRGLAQEQGKYQLTRSISDLGNQREIVYELRFNREGKPVTIALSRLVGGEQ